MSVTTVRNADKVIEKFNRLSDTLKLQIKLETLDALGNGYKAGFRARVHKITGRGERSIYYVRISSDHAEVRGIEYLISENARGSRPTKPPFNMPPHNFIEIVVNQLTPSLITEIRDKVRKHIVEIFTKGV